MAHSKKQFHHIGSHFSSNSRCHLNNLDSDRGLPSYCQTMDVPSGKANNLDRVRLGLELPNKDHELTIVRLSVNEQFKSKLKRSLAQSQSKPGKTRQYKRKRRKFALDVPENEADDTDSDYVLQTIQLALIGAVVVRIGAAAGRPEPAGTQGGRLGQSCAHPDAHVPRSGRGVLCR